jgi:hypothetical protein
MKRGVERVRGGAIAIALMGVAMALAGCTDDTTGSEETLTFSELDAESRFAQIGNYPPGRNPPPGRGFSLSIPLQEAQGTETVGTINAVCIATKPGPQEPNLRGTCSGTADVPDGQLALSVGGEIAQDVTGAIVGGTGKYEGATGTFTSKSLGGDTIDTFNVTLP